MASHIIQKCLYSTSQALNKWNKEIFGIVQTRIRDLEEDLKSTHNQQGSTGIETKVIHNQLPV